MPDSQLPALATSHSSSALDQSRSLLRHEQASWVYRPLHPRARGQGTVPSDMDALASAAVERYGRIDVLVNNALASYKFDPSADGASIKTARWESFEEQFAGTVGGAVNAVKAVLPHMEERGYGKIVNIGTVRNTLEFIHIIR